MSFLYHSYIIRIRMSSYVTHMSIQFNIILHVIRMSLACARMSSVCHLHVIRISLVCSRMSSVRHSHVLVFQPYVTRLWFYHEPFISRLFFIFDLKI